MNPMNLGVGVCDACKQKRRILGLGPARVCSSCTRVLVAGWAVLGRMYPAIAHELVGESRHELGEHVPNPADPTPPRRA